MNKALTDHRRLRGAIREPVGPAARLPGKVAPPAAPTVERNTPRGTDVDRGMNPEIRHLIATGILRTSPLRPRSAGDAARIRAAFAHGRS
jgi:hypothetical protein